jgi:hypothetical protein
MRWESGAQSARGAFRAGFVPFLSFLLGSGGQLICVYQVLGIDRDPAMIRLALSPHAEIRDATLKSLISIGYRVRI